MGNPTVNPPMPDTTSAGMATKRVSKKKREKRQKAQDNKASSGSIKSGFSITGSLSAYAGLYTTSLKENRNQPTPLGVGGYATINLPGGISIPFSVTLGNQGAAFRQPFNQYGVSPTWRWITLHAGYRNVVFSPFTLAGHTFLGGGVELNPGLLRLGFVYGRFNKAIQSDLANPDVVPAYNRLGYAAKLGIGRGANYIDLLLMRAADDSASIGPVRDSTQNSPRPAENAVVGISGRSRLFNFLTIELDGALSAYTRDVRSRTVSFADSSSIYRTLEGQDVFKLRQSSQITSALQGAIGYSGRTAGLKLNYRRLDPNFQTMGAYFFQSDLIAYTVSPMLNLFNGKARLSGSYGWQEDNLYRNKAATSRRIISSANLSLNPTQAFGIDLSYSDYGIGQRPGRQTIIDTIRLAQNNSTLTANIRYAINQPTSQQVITLTASRQALADLNSNTAAQTESDNLIFNGGYFYQPIKAGFGLNGTFSYTTTRLPTFSDTIRQRSNFYGPTIGGTLQQFNQKLSLAGNLSYLVSEQQNENGQVITITGSASYKLHYNQNISLQYVYLYSNPGGTLPGFNETRLTLVYGLSLSSRRN
jgi:hypothetical protein